jgi:hypothetical protein
MRVQNTQENPGLRPQDWTPTYWNDAQHGSKWDRVKEALARDWAQTRSDFSDAGKDLHQNVVDTVRQAVGTEALPPPGEPNLRPRTAPGPIAPWSEAQTAVRYGVAAFEQYGSQYPRWSDELEVKLSTEWDEKVTGRPFHEVRADVRKGWEAKS